MRITIHMSFEKNGEDSHCAKNTKCENYWGSFLVKLLYCKHIIYYLILDLIIMRTVIRLSIIRIFNILERTNLSKNAMDIL